MTFSPGRGYSAAFAVEGEIETASLFRLAIVAYAQKNKLVNLYQEDRHSCLSLLDDKNVCPPEIPRVNP